MGRPGHAPPDHGRQDLVDALTAAGWNLDHEPPDVDTRWRTVLSLGNRAVALDPLDSTVTLCVDPGAGPTWGATFDRSAPDAVIAAIATSALDAS
jgi:hypothetical protein